MYLESIQNFTKKLNRTLYSMLKSSKNLHLQENDYNSLEEFFEGNILPIPKNIVYETFKNQK